MATTWMKALHRSGSRRSPSGSIAAALDRTVDYAENPDKTNDGELIDSYECHRISYPHELQAGGGHG